MEVKRRNKSKYNFGSCKVGEEIKVDFEDTFNMFSSLLSFNRRHGKSIEIEPKEVDRENKQLIYTVTNI